MTDQRIPPLTDDVATDRQKAAMAAMAPASGTDLAGYDAQLKATAMFYPPAEAVGFTDRGEIAPGKRADLVRVHVRDGMPIVREVYREGRRVL